MNAGLGQRVPVGRPQQGILCQLAGVPVDRKGQRLPRAPLHVLHQVVEEDAGEGKGGAGGVQRTHHLAKPPDGEGDAGHALAGVGHGVAQAGALAHHRERHDALEGVAEAVQAEEEVQIQQAQPT